MYKQLYSGIKAMILSGCALGGEKLPPIRKAADILEVNPATVVKAYDMLEREGIVYKIIGSGSYISLSEENMDNIENNKEDLNNHQIKSFSGSQIQLKESINFASATPSTCLFPVTAFKRAINKVIERDGADIFGYQEIQGYYPLRKKISKLLMKEGIETSSKYIQVVSGSQQGLDILSKNLLKQGDNVIVEEPTYSGAINIFKNNGARINSIPLLEDGMDMEKLEALLKRIKINFFYTMGNINNPTGISWSLENKHKLLELANLYNFYIIEDDCVSELYFYTEKAPKLKTLDKFDKVIYIKSYSKIFMPGIRLAYVVIPESMMDSIINLKFNTDISTSGLNQIAFEYYLGDNEFENHLSYLRRIYKTRYLKLKEYIEKSPYMNLIFLPQGGLYMWIRLNEGMKSKKIYEIALANGVSFLPGDLFMYGVGDESIIRLSFAGVTEEEIVKGMQRLDRSIEEYLGIAEEKNEFKYTPLV